jgi:repressor LexA
MSEIGARLKTLRESLGASQAKLGKLAGLSQAAVNRYENGQALVPVKVLLWYADYFDVSLDYLCGRTDKPQGKLYECKPKLSNSKEMQQFIEMCFDPKSPVNARLKETLLQMMEEQSGK